MFEQFALISRQSIEYCQRLKQYLAFLLLVGLIQANFSITAAAQAFSSNIVDKAMIEERIDKLKNNNTFSDTEKNQITAQLQLILIKLQSIVEQKRQAKNYAASLTSAASKQAKFSKQFDKLKAFKLSKAIKNAPLDKLENLLAKDNVEMASIRKRIEQVLSDIKNERAFDIQVALTAARQPISADINLTLELEGVEDIKFLLDSVNDDLQQAKIENLEQRLLSRNARLSLWEYEQRFLNKQSSILASRIDQIQALVTYHRQTEAHLAMTKAEDILESLASESKIIIDMAQYNITLANEFNKLIDDQQIINQQKETTAKEAKSLQQKFTSLTEQLAISQLGNSPEFSAALRKQRDQLTDVNRTNRSLQNQKKALTDSRLAQFRVDALRESEIISGHVSLFEQIRADSDLSSEREQLITNMLIMRKNTLEKLSLAYWDYISSLSSLTLQNEALIIQSKQYAELLAQQILWMPSSNPVGLKTISDFDYSIETIWKSNNWALIKKTIKINADKYFIVIVTVGFLVIALTLRRNKLIELLSNMKDRVGKVNKDKIWLSLLALLYTFLLALPGPLLLFIFSFLVNAKTPFTEALESTLVYAAIIYLILNFMLESTRKSGILGLHFKWSLAIVTALRNNLPWLIAIAVPAITLNLLIESSGDSPIRDSIGRLAFITATLAMAIFARNILLPHNKNLKKAKVSDSDFSHWFLYYVQLILIIFVPLILISISIYGYHYTAVQLETYLLNSALVILLGGFSYNLAQRGFAINERRLALDRLRAKRAAEKALNEAKEDDESNAESGPSAVDLQTIDLQTISKQTKSLLKLIVIMGVALALWNVWSGIFPAFKPLVNVVLWQVIETVNGVQSLVPITLWNLLLAVVSIIVTFLAAKNLAGVLEAAFFSRMQLRPGSSYAITTLAQYIIVIIGSVIALQWLGAQWSKVQWLVAALSVGLGFGLQEIVANFVSGVVILFERPIRIGDTVTVGDQWGSVTRIQMRATTIIDWDRREVIVPNKAFTQEKLTNWTLSDAITRRKINVGVAYGSDVELVEKVLLKIASENSKVLDDPAPEALFVSFGDSCLDFCLRVFVRGYREHAAVAHELHKAIDKEFRANNIEIAFPQMDLHFDQKSPELPLIEQTNSSKTSSKPIARVNKNKKI